MTVVKICGLTNLDDAQCAVEAGADLLGFILYPKSPRFIPPARIAPITTALRDLAPTMVTVGVFVNETPDNIVRALDEAGLDLAQLSGDEPPDDLRALQGRGYKAVREATGAQSYLSPIQTPNAKLQNQPDLLLDANHPTLYGGSGMRADESLAAALSQKCRLLLAGGLTPDNVANAIRMARPWGVDVSSGIESAPGRKDHAKVRAFIAAAKEA